MSSQDYYQDVYEHSYEESTHTHQETDNLKVESRDRVKKLLYETNHQLDAVKYKLNQIHSYFNKISEGSVVNLRSAADFSKPSLKMTDTLTNLQRARRLASNSDITKTIETRKSYRVTYRNGYYYSRELIGETSRTVE